MRHDIRPLPGEDIFLYIKRCRSFIGEYRSISTTHITWYTHKNPYGCWVCDSLLDWESQLNFLEDMVEARFNNAKSSRPDDMTGKRQGRNQDDDI